MRRIRPASDTPEDVWPATVPAIGQVLRDGIHLPPGVTFLVGENGSGKSTLIEALALAYGLNPEGGSRYAMHSSRATESPLGDWLELERAPGGRGHAYFLRAETMHGYYTYLENLPDAPPQDRGLHTRSHGEGFIELLRRKFGSRGFYLMDEPESALSFTSCLALLSLLIMMAEEGSQVVVATHSPILTAMPGATILQLGVDGIHPAAWDDLEIVWHWRQFLAGPERFIQHLTGEG